MLEVCIGDLGNPGCCSGKQVEARTIEVRNNGVAAAMLPVRRYGQQIIPTRDVANSTARSRGSPL